MNSKHEIIHKLRNVDDCVKSQIVDRMLCDKRFMVLCDDEETGWKKYRVTDPLRYLKFRMTNCT